MGKFSTAHQLETTSVRCAIGTLLESDGIDDDDREAIVRNLHAASAPKFAAWLGELGVKTTYTTAKRHRRGECCIGLTVGR
jgi:hypothetical protein